MGRPRAVLLDFDDTLLDGSSIPVAVHRTCADLARRLGHVSAEDLQRANADAFATYWPEAEPRCALGSLDIMDASRELWRRTLMGCGIEDETLTGFAFERYQRTVRELARVFDDVHPLLRSLREAAILTALVTNSSPAGQMERLNGVGLAHAFDAVVVSGELGVAKPDPAIFMEALRRLGLGTDDAWHVGDSLSTDVAGATAAGIRSVWLNRDGRSRSPSSPRPDVEITSLDELVGLLHLGTI